MKLLLVMEMPLIGSIVASVLEAEPDIEVAGCVDSLEGARRFLRQQAVQMVLASAGLPDQGALTLVREIVDEMPGVRVLALGLSENDRQHALRYIEAGACGYILKDSSVQELLEVIRLAQKGEAQVSTQMAGAMMRRLSSLARLFSPADQRLDGDAHLTSRELEVLQFISQGLTNQQIAARLVVEVGTVKNHVHRILEKLNVKNREEAASYLAFMRINS